MVKPLDSPYELGTRGHWVKARGAQAAAARRSAPPQPLEAARQPFAVAHGALRRRAQPTPHSPYCLGVACLACNPKWRHPVPQVKPDYVKGYEELEGVIIGASRGEGRRAGQVRRAPPRSHPSARADKPPLAPLRPATCFRSRAARGSGFLRTPLSTSGAGERVPHRAARPPYPGRAAAHVQVVLQARRGAGAGGERAAQTA